MFIRKYSEDSRKLDPVPGAAGGAGGAPAGNGQQGAAGGQSPANAPAGGQNNNQDNNDPNLTTVVNPWQNEETPGAAQPGNAGGAQPAQNGNAGGQGQDVQAAFQQHLESLDFMDGVDVRGIADQIAGGQNVEEALSGAFTQMARNTYTNMLRSTQKLMQSAIKKEVQSATQEATGSLRADLATQRMTQALPFTSDPSILPVAQGALSRFLEKGQDLETAIGNVKNYFTAVAQRVGGQPGGQGGKGGRNRQGSQFLDTNELDSAGSGDIDFMSLFTPGSG